VKDFVLWIYFAGEVVLVLSRGSMLYKNLQLSVTNIICYEFISWIVVVDVNIKVLIRLEDCFVSVFLLEELKYLLKNFYSVYVCDFY
jgi:hypothetical protein